MTVAEKEAMGISKFAPVKKVLQKDADGNIVAEHYSLKQAADAVGSTVSAVGNAIHRKGKCKGFYFEHEEPQKTEFKMPERRGFNHVGHVPYGGSTRLRKIGG